MVLTGLTGSESWVEHCWSQAAIITTRDRETDRQTDRQTEVNDFSCSPPDTSLTGVYLNQNCIVGVYKPI